MFDLNRFFVNTVLLIMGVLVPPAGFVFVIIKETNDINKRYLHWGLNILLTLCLWLPGAIHFLYYWIKQGHFTAD